MADTPPNSTKFVLGSTGSGKTTLMANLLLGESRFVVFDVKGEYDPQFFPESVVVGTNDELIRTLNQNRGRIIYRFDRCADCDIEIDRACRLIYAFQERNARKLPPVTVALDEFNRFVSSGSCPKSIEDVIQRGRGQNIRKIFGAQWFNSIPTWCRDGFTEMYVFKHTDRAGIDMLMAYGFDPDIVPQIPDYHCLYRGKQGIKLLSLKPSVKQLSAKSNTQNSGK